MERITLMSLLFTAVVSSSPRQYHFVNQRMNWTEAQRYCREEHTDLVTINDIQEQNEIKQLINSNSERVWIGLKDSWMWSLTDPDFYRGDESQYRNWGTTQPNEKGDCVSMNTDGQWNNIKCGTTRSFICYNDKLVLIRENKTWTEALRYCRDRDMDLVSVYSEQIQRRVMDVTSRASSNHVWLGLRHSCALRFWFWVNGNTMCYNQWAPDYTIGLDDCVNTVRSGAIRTCDNRWISLPETDRNNFICVK
ncbi:C-type mannose receptor 2-like isoform X2 [Puntigrus tetrazona]|uniref:C-type mannose receptor 2-like isoform X2 n=1 Tax=Puntigrus tetrazona TaxID=1606681 RepID=UPI001C8AB47D|nr:C-type mannose receptor 2-like isoform X2 [Puntigrus tetrazona]